MGKPLTVSSAVKCGHGGTATVKSTAKLRVNGSAVLTSAGVTAWTIAPGCSQTNTQAGNVPCAKVLSQQDGKSQKLTAGGSPVVLDGITGTTNGKPLSDLSASAGQTKLTAA